MTAGSITFYHGYWWLRDLGQPPVDEIPEARWQKKRKMWKAPDTFRTRKGIERLADFRGASVTDVGQARLARHNEIVNAPGFHPFPELFPFKTRPYAFQKDILDQVWQKDYHALFLEAGAGKTKIALDLAAVWRSPLTIIICETSLVTEWKSQYEIHYAMGIDDRVFDVNDLKKGRVPEQATSGVHLVIGVEALQAGRAIDALPLLMTRYYDRGDDITVILDESSSIKNHKAKRTKTVLGITELSSKRLIMNGTPITQGYQDLYSQVAFLSNDVFGFSSFYAFRNRYCLMGGWESKTIIGYDNLDELYALLMPHATLLKKEDVIDDLPPKLPVQRRWVDLTAEQKRLYKDCRDRELTFEGHEFTLEMILEVYLRLMQIVGGFLPVDENNERQALIGSGGNKVAEVLRVMELHANDQVVVACRFVPEVELVSEALRGQGYKVVTFTGDTENPDKSLDDFKRGDAQIIVMTYAKGSKGLNLDMAKAMIMYSLTFSYEQYSQMRDRIHRATTRIPKAYYEIATRGTIDEDVIDALERKQDLAKTLGEKLR